MPETISSEAADLALLEELNQGFIRAVANSDVAWFERNLAQDFVNSNPDGSFVDRAAFLRQVAPPCPVADFGVEDVRIALYGDTALARGRTVYTKADGQRAAGRYTDVWLRAGERWVCVSGDVTRG
jgi:ketosteroid isomerase-like protein